MKPTKIKNISLVIILLSCGKLMSQVPGTLDSTFANNGQAYQNVVVGESEYPYSTLVLPNDKILVLSNTGNKFFLAKYTADGAIDPSFGNNSGYVIYDYSSIITGYNMTLTNDNKVLVAGALWDGSIKAYIARINIDDGSVDQSFGDSSIVTFDNGQLPKFHDIEVVSGNNIIAAGTSYNGQTYDPLFVKFTQGGGLSVTYGLNGYTQIQNINGDQVINSIKYDGNGNIYGVGYYTVDSTNQTFGEIYKVKANGDLDSSFSLNGHKLYSRQKPNEDSQLRDLLIVNNSVLAVGYEGDGTGDDGFIIKLNANGTYDSTFATNGKLLSDIGTSNRLRFHQIIENNGDFVTSGEAFGASTASAYAYMFKANGSPTGFPNAGVYHDVDKVNSPSNINGYMLSKQNDGGIIIGGQYNSATTPEIRNSYLMKLHNVKVDTVNPPLPTSLNQNIENEGENIIFPNPVTNHFSIKNSYFKDGDNINLRLYSVTGELVNEWIGKNQIYKIDFLPEGIYYLKILVNGNNLTVNKLIISK